MEVHDKNAPISQPSTSSQEASGGSKKSDLKSVGGSLGSELSNLNLQELTGVYRLSDFSFRCILCCTNECCRRQGEIKKSLYLPYLYYF